jgi:hypothetical protein
MDVVKHLLKHATNRLNTLNIKMEQKIDLNSIIGFALILVLIFYHVSKSTGPKGGCSRKSTKGIAN